MEIIQRTRIRSKSFNKETVKIFEEIMEISTGTLETIEEQCKEEVDKTANIIQRLTRSLKYKGLRPKTRKKKIY